MYNCGTDTEVIGSDQVMVTSSANLGKMKTFILQISLAVIVVWVKSGLNDPDMLEVSTDLNDKWSYCTNQLQLTCAANRVIERHCSGSTHPDTMHCWLVSNTAEVLETDELIIRIYQEGGSK